MRSASGGYPYVHLCTLSHSPLNNISNWSWQGIADYKYPVDTVAFIGRSIVICIVE